VTNGHKERVVIAGGGIAALTAAYYLSATPDLRDRYHVTLYQMGWRLGGKCASSRDAQCRNVEHGLHVWFGCYDNAFGLMSKVYRDWSNPLKPTLGRIFKKRFDSRIGTSADNDVDWVCVPWPDAPGSPWDSPRPHTLTPFYIVGRLIDHVHEMVQASADLGEAPVDAQLRLEPSELQYNAPEGFGEDLSTVAGYLSLAHEVMVRSGDASSEPMTLINTATFTRSLVAASLDSLMVVRSADKPHYIAEAIELARALIVGLITDIIIGSETLDTLDDTEFRDWLMSHGARQSTVETSPFLKALYDTMFQYPGGNQNNGDYAAGTALQVVTRLLGTYRGAPLYIPQFGLGESVIGPLYEVLKQNGVQFEFFHKLHRVVPNQDGDKVGAITFQVQALPKNTYTPVIEIEGLPAWPDQPFWDQLHADDIPDGTDFESHWNPHPPADEKTLELDTDFDNFILGVSLGALGAAEGETGIADDLRPLCRKLDSQITDTPLVPSKAAQVWFTETAIELGQDPPRHAAVSGPEAFDIYADMTQVLDSEPDQDPPEQSLFYLCTTYDTDLYRRPARDADTPALALADVTERFDTWKDIFGLKVWPLASADGAFDPARIAYQVVRANVNPTDCCPSSATGTTRLRLEARGTAFSNLYLTGCWTRTGFHTTCVEAAVMSGMQAARALSGTPQIVFGETFLRETTHFEPFRQPVACIDRMIDRLLPFAHARFAPRKRQDNSGFGG